MQHLEKYIGPISAGWDTRTDAGRAPFQVIKFASSPFRECDALSSLGLSRFPLAARQPGKLIQLELLMMIRGDAGSLRLPSLILEVGGEMLKSGHAILKGEIVGPRGPLWGTSKLEALYATSPSYLPEGSDECELEDGAMCAIVWLVPLTRGEASYATSHGWRVFEELLAKQNPDLLAQDREEIDLR